MGDISMQTGEDAEAIQSYRKAIELDPKSPLAYSPLALLLADKPDTVGDARRQAEQAMALAPNSPDALDALGWVHIQQGQIKQGLELLHRTQKLSPRVPRVLYHLGVGYYKDNQPEKAKQWLEAALAINHHFRGSEQARDIVQKITVQH
jgi:Tfp pilus assembly protein PilF